MDDRRALAQSYRCPGASYSIDRATHMGRLTVFYEGCLQCAHRDDLHELTAPQVRDWEQVLARQRTPACFGAEGFEADSINDFTPQLVARVTTALAATLWRGHARASAPPRVLVGCDGHWSTADLLAAACDALQLSGCVAIEAGAATSPSLVAATQHLSCDALMWIGNATGEPHAMAMRWWGERGMPWSSAGALDAVRDAFDAGASRPRRSGGRLERAGLDQWYLPKIEGLFHALRPLRLVVDTECQLWASQLRQLTRGAACEVLRLADCPPLASHADRSGPSSWLERRWDSLGRHVIDRQAHFGLWVDGCGESCRLIDEHGRLVATGRLSQAMAAFVLAEQPQATLLIDSLCEACDRESLEQLGATVAVAAGPTREQMWTAMQSHGAALGFGRQGACWFAGPSPAPDALLALSLLLALFSQSDRPCSAALDARATAL